MAAFVDEGNAVNDVFDPLATGVGGVGGIRWVSPPVGGPLRLDVARGGLNEELGGGWRIHFSMGGPEL